MQACNHTHIFYVQHILSLMPFIVLSKLAYTCINNISTVQLNPITQIQEHIIFCFMWIRARSLLEIFSNSQVELTRININFIPTSCSDVIFIPELFLSVDVFRKGLLLKNQKLYLIMS